MKKIAGFVKVEGLSQSLKPNAIYFEQQGSKVLGLHLSNATGTSVRSLENVTISSNEIQDLLSKLMKRITYDPNSDNKIDVEIIEGLSLVSKTRSYADLLNKPILGPMVEENDFNGPNQLIRLNESGVIPSVNLIGYSDEVKEYDTLSDFPAIGSSSIIYINSEDGKRYRWKDNSYKKMDKEITDTDSLVEGTNNLFFSDARMIANSPVRSVAGLSGIITSQLLKTSMGLLSASTKNIGTTATDVSQGKHSHLVNILNLTGAGLVGSNAAGAAKLLTLGNNLAFSSGKLIYTPVEGSIYDYGIITPAVVIPTLTIDLSKGSIQKVTYNTTIHYSQINLDVLPASLTGNKIVHLFVKMLPNADRRSGPLIMPFYYDPTASGPTGTCLLKLTGNLAYNSGNIVLQEAGILSPFTTSIYYGAETRLSYDYYLRITFYCINGKVWITSSCFKGASPYF